jgi:hypothetical protein
MKRVFSLLIAVIVLLSVFSFSPSRAQAAGIISYAGGNFIIGKGIAFVFHGSGLRNRDVRGANIFVGSDFYPLGCTVNKEEKRIVCVLRGGLTEYAGETGIIYLGGQIFYVIIPDLKEAEESEDEGSSCEEPLVSGADVTFEDIGGGFSTHFIEGDTIKDVRDAADEELANDPDLVDYKVGDLYCGSGGGPEEQ